MQRRRLVIPAVAIAAFFAGTMVNVGFTQAASPGQQPPAQQQPTVFVIDYMKVPPGGSASYEAVEREIWKRVHAERQRQGLSRSWALYRVRFPYGSAREYDYVTINAYRSLAELDGGFSPELMARAVPEIPLDEITRRTRAARDMVRSDVLYLVDRVP